MALIIQVVYTSPKLTILVAGYSDAACSFAVRMRYFSIRNYLLAEKCNELLTFMYFGCLSCSSGRCL